MVSSNDPNSECMIAGAIVAALQARGCKLLGYSSGQSCTMLVPSGGRRYTIGLVVVGNRCWVDFNQLDTRGLSNLMFDLEPPDGLDKLVDFVLDGVPAGAKSD